MSTYAIRGGTEGTRRKGLATREELDTTIASLTELTDDPRSVVGLPRIFQAWGRKRSTH